MAPETPPLDTSAEALPTLEAAAASPEEAAQDAAPAPVLNRAERRAQAKGKASPPGAGGQGTGPGSAPRAPGARGGGHVGQVRFPRTGHK